MDEEHVFWTLIGIAKAFNNLWIFDFNLVVKENLSPEE